jgi:peptidoglycan/xylan/chitin deacetylase (PgdA/CDA1 family)
MYHQISPAGETGSRLAVAPEAFAEQLAYLRDAGFETVTASCLAETLAGRAGPLPDRTVVLTFDDGFEDFHRRAMPILGRYGYTATVFVTTGWVQDAGPQAAPRRPGRMLSWSQVTEAAQAGMEVGAHSWQHPQLDQLPGSVLREELYASKAQLEDRLGGPVPGLAYPFGYSSAKVREVARDAGHGYACVVGNTLLAPGPDLLAPGPDLLALPRLTIRRSTGLPAFRQIAHGQDIPAMFRRDRALTRGYAIARRSRAALGSVARGK